MIRFCPLFLCAFITGVFASGCALQRSLDERELKREILGGLNERFEEQKNLLADLREERERARLGGNQANLEMLDHKLSVHAEELSRTKEQIAGAKGEIKQLDIRIGDERKASIGKHAIKWGGITGMLGKIVSGFNPVIGTILGTVATGMAAVGGAFGGVAGKAA